MLVVFAYYPGDQKLAAKLSSWIVELGRNEGHSALVVRDDRCNPNYDSEIKSNLLKTFDSVETVNVVEKLDSDWQSSTNSAFGPNVMFRTAAKHIQYTKPQPWLWCEVDCVPLKTGWVQELAVEYDQEPRKPFLGDFVKVDGVIPHCSGIAVYPGVITDHAGDAVMAMETAWDVAAAHQIVPQMKQTVKIQHRWHHPPFQNQGEVDNLLEQLKDTCVLFHSDKSGTLIDFLRERRDGRKPQQTQSSVNVGAGIGTVDVFVKSYAKDAPWLEWCLRSIRKFASGFRGVQVISPDAQTVVFPTAPYDQSWKVLPEYGNDHYLSQQVFKLYADTFTDADWILFTDSDTIFTRPVTPETYLKNGKFVWMMTPMNEAHPDEQQAWRRVMRKFFGKEPEYEFMRRHPFLLPRWLLADLRAFCVRQHGIELKDYVMAQPYREFTEFNILGMYAYEYHRDKFEWLDTSKVPEAEWPILTVDQQWSHNPIPVEKWEAILQSESMVKTKSVDPDLARLSTNETNLNSGLQSTSSNGLTMQDHVKALGEYASKDGFARMRVIKQLRAVNLIPKKK